MSGSVIGTGTSGIDQTGTAYAYVPPNVTAVPRGFTVNLGTYAPYNAGDEIDATGQVIQIANGSGVLQPVGTAVYRTVTITAPTGAVDSGDVS